MIRYKYSKKDYSNKLDENMKNDLRTLLFFNINKFMLLLREVVYPNEYVDERKKFNETPFPKKEEFYRNLNMENITNVDYMHAKRVCKDFEIKNWSEYHDLYLKSDKLFLADVFENFKEMYLEIYQKNPSKFLSLAGLAWQAV